jgi:zinc transporter ZupT
MKSFQALILTLLFLTASSALSRGTVSRGQQVSSANLRWQVEETVHRALEAIETQAPNTTATDDHDDDDHEKPWGEVIVASLIINLVSFSGLFFVAFGTLTRKHYGSSLKYKGWKFTSNIIPSFACGALLATTAFLIIPESLGMILSHLESHSGEESHSEEADDHADHDRRFLEEEHDDHEDEEDFDSAVAWRFGTCLLAGFLIPIITGMLVSGGEHKPKECEICEEDKIPNKMINEGSPRDSTALDTEDKSNASCNEDCTHKQECDETCNVKCDGDHVSQDHGHDGHDDHAHDHKHHMHEHDHPGHSDECIDSSPVINYSLAAGILLGDFFHNFADGIFVGTAFTLCSHDLAVTISVATIYHEIAQEIADFYILTKHCNLKIWVALLLNFMGGLSVMIGALIVLAVDINGMISGCILAVGAGVYINIAATECLPRARETHDCRKDKIMSIISFFVGVVPIGLVLLNHLHCDGL